MAIPIQAPGERRGVSQRLTSVQMRNPFITCGLVTLGLLLPFHPVATQQLDFTGRAEAVVAEPFSLVDGVRELPGGRLIVTDRMERRLFLVDFQTGVLREIGRTGDGPGEYRFPSAPLAGPGDTTWVADAVLRRLLVITADGRIVAGLPMPAGGLASARGTDRQGRIYFEGSSFDSDRGRFLDTVAVVRWAPGAARIEPVGQVWSGGRVVLNRPGGLSSLSRSITPFPHLDAWVALPDGRVAVVGHQPFRIDFTDGAAGLRTGATIPFTPVPVTARDRDAFREQVAVQRSAALRVGGGAGPSGQALEFDDADYPRTMPPFIAATVRATPEGEIWIGRSHATTDRTWRYDIFDGTGRVVGSATLPVGSVVVGFGIGTVYLARTDPDDDLVYLERHRR